MFFVVLLFWISWWGKIWMCGRTKKKRLSDFRASLHLLLVWVGQGLIWGDRSNLLFKWFLKAYINVEIVGVLNDRWNCFGVNPFLTRLAQSDTPGENILTNHHTKRPWCVWSWFCTSFNEEQTIIKIIIIFFVTILLIMIVLCQVPLNIVILLSFFYGIICLMALV